LSIELILILFVIGIATGVLSGLFGVGGGIIIVPSLIAVYSYTGFDSPYVVHIAIATSLFTIIFTSISSAHKHFGHGNVDWPAALIIGLTSSVMVYFFSKAALALPGDVLKKIFSVVLIVVAVKMLFDRKKPAGEKELTEVPVHYNKFVCGIIGILSGAIAAFSGLGGGVFVVPLMHYILKFPFKKAIGTSSAAILITAIAGVLSYYFNMPGGVEIAPYSFGMVDTLSALPVIAASIPFARLGVYINSKTHHSLLAKLFAVFILIVSLKLLFF
jgi:uncharacterized membrane protein YfcA